MKSVRLHQGSTVIIRPTSTVAKMNGIKTKEVPDLLAAWEEMHAVKRRKDGGFDIIKRVAPGDPQAVGIVRRRQMARKIVGD